MNLSELESTCAILRSLVGDVEVRIERFGGYSLNGYLDRASRVEAVPHNKTVIAVIT